MNLVLDAVVARDRRRDASGVAIGNHDWLEADAIAP
jgi:hypothetical protein